MVDRIEYKGCNIEIRSEDGGFCSYVDGIRFEETFDYDRDDCLVWAKEWIDVMQEK